MSEYTIGYLFCGGIVGLAIACLFYMLGGRSNKALRRFIAPAIITATICLIAFARGTFKIALLALYIFKMLEYIQGYSDRSGFGWIKRIGVAATSMAGGVYLCWIFGGGWSLLIIHGALSASTVFFSFKNPIAASAEEPLICILNSLMLIAYPFV